MKAVRTMCLLVLLALAAGALHGQEGRRTQDSAKQTTDSKAAKSPTTGSQEKSAGKAPARSVSEVADAVTEISVTVHRLQSLVVASARSVRQVADTITEISASIDQLHNLVVIAIGVSLINILINVWAFLSWLRRPKARESTQEKNAGEDVPRVEPAPAPPRPTDPPGPVTPRPEEPPSALPETPEPPPRPVEKVEKPQRPPAPPEPDELAGLPHAPVGRALSRLHRALPDLARKFPDPRQQERFLAELDLPLKARIERFKDATRRGDAYLKEHWIEPDLVTTLNALAQMLSSVIEERYRGRRGNRMLEEELRIWLYDQLAPVCRAEGWFVVEQVLPFTTRFDPKIHHSVGSVEVQGADDLIVGIKAIGRRDVRQGFVTHKAQVLVGR